MKGVTAAERPERLHPNSSNNCYYVNNSSWTIQKPINPQKQETCVVEATQPSCASPPEDSESIITCVKSADAVHSSCSSYGQKLGAAIITATQNNRKLYQVNHIQHMNVVYYIWI